MNLLKIYNPHRTLVNVFPVVFLIYFSMQSSFVNCLNGRRNNIENLLLSDNQTNIFSNVNGTGEILLKRAGEFASRALGMKQGKFVLPAGTIFSIAPKITIPAFRRKAFKGGLNSDFQASWYFYINFDKMGYTSQMHWFPFDRPPFYPFGSLMRPIESKDFPEEDKDKKKDQMKPNMMKPQKHHSEGPFHHSHPPPHSSHHHHQGPPPSHSMNHQYPQDYTVPEEYGSGGTGDSFKNIKQDTVYTFFPITKKAGEATNKNGGTSSRKPRSVMSLPPPDVHPGGERVFLLPGIENMMSSFGFDGKCMLRAICEIHEFPMQKGYGLLGEMITLFFSVSKSPYADSHMPEYLKAENAGRNGDCASYRSLCKKSIFKWDIVKKQDEDVDTNEVPIMSPYRSKFEDDEL